MTETLTFDQLPSAVSLLGKRLESIELLLTQKSESKQQTEPQDQLFTTEEAAEFLSLAVPTIYSMCSRGELPHMKRSKRLYFSRKELTEYLQTGRKKSNKQISQEATEFLSNRGKEVSHGK